MNRKTTLLFVLFSLTLSLAHADTGVSDFRPIAGLPAPSPVRLADGRPGPDYWQQHIDYDITATLDTNKKHIVASGDIRYTNNSPNTLDTIWFELALNETTAASIHQQSRTAAKGEINEYLLSQVANKSTTQGGTRVHAVEDAHGNNLEYRVRGTQMRVRLNKPLRTGDTARLHIKWSASLVDITWQRARAGYSHNDGEPLIFHLAQWYPQPVAYTDYGGWRNTPFVGAGEFTPEMGDYKVALTLPAGYTVAATGELQNPKQVLSKAMLGRLKNLKVDQPADIITAEEARLTHSGSREKTWRFKASNVRDFAFAASQGYIWEAMLTDAGNGEHTTVMSFYPEKAAPLWRRFSMQAIAHTVGVYARNTIPYAYPTIQAAYGPVDGMEHSMLSFSAYAPDGEDGQSYSREMKQYFLWVLVHEVGHSWFPLMVNSDERTWGWMDEGLNSYLEHLTLLEWSDDYITRPNSPRQLGSYAGANSLEPPMTPASSVRHLFASQYNRPAAALMVLRELILGRDVFDDAFRHYAKNWTFKRPTPADFFRSIEQSAGMDLSWFWRGWFYSTSHVDLSLESVENIQPVAVAADTQTGAAGENISWEQDITIERNKQAGLGQVVHAHPHLGDVYDAQRATSPEAVPVTEKQVNALQERLDQLTQNGHYYRVVVRNQGGILSPIPLQIIYKDGSSERRVLPVEIWYANNSQAKPLLYTQKEVTSIELDPLGETGDIAPLNNGGPVPPSLSREPVKVYPDSREFL